jgi:hypothetical protein
MSKNGKNTKETKRFPTDLEILNLMNPDNKKYLDLGDMVNFT